MKRLLTLEFELYGDPRVDDITYAMYNVNSVIEVHDGLYMDFVSAKLDDELLVDRTGNASEAVKSCESKYQSFLRMMGL